MTPQHADLLTPIPGANPAGAYLRYEPIYEQIREARREDDQLPQGDWQKARKVAEWPVVIKLATEALTKRTKDLQVAAWLTEAWLRREGFAGLRNGLELIHELLQQYWDSIYPEIEDGDTDMRAAPLAWLGLKLDMPVHLVPLNASGHDFNDHRLCREVPTEQEAESSERAAEDRAARIAEGRVPPEEIERGFQATPKAWYRTLTQDIDASLELLERLDQLCSERFLDPPSFIPLRDALREARQVAGQSLSRKLELEPDEAAASTPADPSGQVPEGLPHGPGGERAAEGAAVRVNVAAGPRDATEAATWIVTAALKLRDDMPTSPAPYLLLRGLRWGELRAGGPRLDPRLLAAPPTDTRTKLKGLLLDAAWPQLLQAGEAAMAQPYGRGWLDLQRYVLAAVAGLGPEYEVVGTAIRGALRALLTDVPELIGQSLMDDSPTANAETRTWLAEEKLLPDGADFDAAVPTRSRALQRDAYDVALVRVRAGDPRGGVELLMREAAQEKSARARFLRRAQAAEVMVGAGMENVALPILRELLTHIENHRLEEWEAGDTIAQPLALLYRCAQHLSAGDVDATALYERICRLDPMCAVQLQAAGSADHEGS